MRILIADDHPIVKSGLAAILQNAYPFSDILQASDGSEATVVLKAHEIDLMLMDIRMPNTDTLLLISQALLLRPGLRILVVSMNPERLFAVRYLKAGAHGYFEKDGAESILLKAIEVVLSGKRYLSSNMLDIATEGLVNGDATPNPFTKLSNREFEVATHLLNGESPSRICEFMSIQPSTMTAFKKRIFDKLGVKTVHDLNLLASAYKYER